MKPNAGIPSGLILFLMMTGSVFAETIELVTYYPARATTGEVDTNRLHASRQTIGGPPYSTMNPADADLPNGTLLVAGQVGINTAAPSNRLHVVSSNPNGDGIRISGTAPGLSLSDGNNQRGMLGVASADGNYGNGTLAGDVSLSSQVGNLRFATTATAGANPDVRMSILANGSVGIGTAAPAASALLDMSSTTRGFLPPRMTTAQRDLIAGPVAGLVIYNTSTGQLNLNNGATWTALAASTGGMTQVVFPGAGATNWTVPAGVTQITTEVWGAGGGGGGASIPGYWGHGGGGGGYGRQLATVTPGNTLTITVGAGGTGFHAVNTDGIAGGFSSVSGMNAPATIRANGGAGGDGNGYTTSNLAFGGGGTSTASFNITGGRGNRIYGVVSSEGGDGANGGAGGVATWDGQTDRAVMTSGIAPGGGGSGWARPSGATNQSGSNDGADGRVVLTY